MSVTDLIERIDEQEHDDRIQRFDRSWDSYDGAHVEPLTILPARGNNQAEINDNVIANYVGLFVDKGISFLFGKDITFETDAEGETDDEDKIEAAWLANRKMTLFHKLAQNGAVTGHGWLRLVERPGDEEPRAMNLDPSYVTPVFEDDDFEAVLGYRIQYDFVSRGERATRRIFYELNETRESWTITDEVSRNPANRAVRFEEFRPEETWPFEFPPLVDCQNLPRANEYWGQGDVERGIDRLNDAINRALSSSQRQVRLHGERRTWTSGISADQIAMLDMGSERIITLPSEASLNALEPSANALEPAIEFYVRLREAMHEIGRIPEVATGKLETAGALSGVALEILYQPLLEMTETKRRLYGGMLAEASRRLNVMKGGSPDVQVTIKWPDVLPEDRKASAEADVLETTLGVSKRTILERRGYDFDKEQERKDEEGTVAGTVADAVETDPAFAGGFGT